MTYCIACGTELLGTFCVKCGHEAGKPLISAPETSKQDRSKKGDDLVGWMKISAGLSVLAFLFFAVWGIFDTSKWGELPGFILSYLVFQGLAVFLQKRQSS